jgi:hypothetical protein
MFESEKTRCAQMTIIYFDERLEICPSASGALAFPVSLNPKLSIPKFPE